MQNTLITATLVTFGFLLVSNVFFRVKTFRTFQKLAEKGVHFNRQHVFNARLLEEEILMRYPQERDLILEHVRSMKLSSVSYTHLTLPTTPYV